MGGVGGELEGEVWLPVLGWSAVPYVVVLAGDEYRDKEF